MHNNAAFKTFQELLSIRNAKDYIRNFAKILADTEVDFGGVRTSLNVSIDLAVQCLTQDILIGGKKLMVIGNGGSAAIAIHTLVDYANAGGLRTVDLMSPAMLTCMANDYGYENVFAKPIEIFADEGDILFAISSSGKSPNILKACEVAIACKCWVVTFSGFSADNPLRKLGGINFYVSSTHYGFVEIAHQALIHCILDLFIRRKDTTIQ